MTNLNGVYNQNSDLVNNTSNSRNLDNIDLRYNRIKPKNNNHDMWQILQKKAKFLADIRLFFNKKNITEITTPILSQFGNTDVFIESVKVDFKPRGKSKTGFLHTSPEFAMKKILAQCPYPIYQICQVFRDNEIGKRHNIEFTMLEWYRPDFSLMDLMQELNDLLSFLFGYRVILKNITYSQIFLDTLSIHPLLCDIDDLQTLCQRYNLPTDNDRQGLLDALFGFVIEPTLGFDMPTVISDYPKQTASLAKLKTDKDGCQVACRFELYINGLEIANAYDELSDGTILKERFQKDNLLRQTKRLPIMPIDTDLIDACDNLPACSGIAVGLDRLFMVVHQITDIGDVLPMMSDKA